MLDELEKNITDFKSIFDSINKNWKQKKRTSKQILDTNKLKKMDERFIFLSKVKAHKLLGAGGGGHWAIFTEKGSRIQEGIKIEIAVE